MKLFGRTFLLFYTLFILLIIIKFFFFELYYIPSESMEDTLLIGDVVLVMKKTEIKKNNVFVFKGKDNKYYIKRCIGVSGDTLLKKDSTLFLNSKPIFLSGESKDIYKVYFNNRNASFLLFDSLGIRFQNNQNGVMYKKYIIANINKINKDIILTKSFIDSVCLFHSSNTTANILKNKIGLLPNGTEIVIPKNEKNMSNLLKFKKLNGCLVDVKEMHAMKINQKNLINENYYFVMGDNRNFSIDSRHFGPIPESAIIGQATHVLFSWSRSNPFFIARIFKKIK